MHSNIESYSAFWDNAKLTETKLRQDLQTRNVTDVFVCGIAYDHCVGEFITIKSLYFAPPIKLEIRSKVFQHFETCVFIASSIIHFIVYQI